MEPDKPFSPCCGCETPQQGEKGWYFAICFATKQTISLSCNHSLDMTRKQIENLLKTHRAQRDFAKAYLDKHYYELEEQDKETEWLNRYVYHKQIVKQLETEKPDDE
ncbi:hypothetical protein ACFSUS_15940 [Spirosoma soli]|uniref:Phage protein n=1 Tax=Spirosoma soli TaxID=1770529 RepID=A0ABW5M568_9BACT